MTLRVRLTAAFLAVVLGPVLLGAVFVGMTVAAVGHARSAERLDVAATGVRTAVAALCDRLTAAADAAGLASQGGRAPEAAEQVIAQGLAPGVQLAGADRQVTYSAGELPAQPWADCRDGGSAAPAGGYPAIAARVELRDASGLLLGYAWAVQPVTGTLIRELADAGGAAVTVLVDTPAGALSTEEGPARGEVVAAARRLPGTAMAQTPGGRYVRRVDPGPGQPLPLALSVGRDDPRGLYAILIAVVVVAGLLAVGAAWWMARSTVAPLTELAYAVQRVAGGDLAARVPVRSHDEVGRLGATFNRMALETQGYVQALTASRDQLRGQLGLLGHTLSSTHDLDRILQVILQTALTATGAQSGAILLLDPASGVLVARCAEGLVLPEELVSPGGYALPEGFGSWADLVRVPVGEGLLGEVAATGEARRGRVDRDGPIFSPNEPRCRTYVAVPFAMANAGGDATDAVDEPTAICGFEAAALPAPRGVLALYDRHGFDEFDDADLYTLRTFAGQAVVALDNVRAHKEVERLSLTDPLTGLSNYRYLQEALRREVERASRFSHTLTVLALDVDRFKEVNDTYGHAAGDAVLAEFARRVRGEIREVDFAFRQGGEEFVVLLPETDAAGGIVVAERLIAAVRRTPVVVYPASAPSPQRIAVTVSIGIAVYPEHGGTGPVVLEAADESLYAAKAAGRDTYRVAQPREVISAHSASPATAGSGGGSGAGSGGASNGTQAPRQSRGG